MRGQFFVSVTTEHAARVVTTRSVDNLICRECGVTYYSAAASAMVSRAETCDCGGLLIELPPDGVLPVGVPRRGRESAPDDEPQGRRFSR
jgi:hypothetical protein